MLNGRKQDQIDRSYRTGKSQTSAAVRIWAGRIRDHVQLRSGAIYQAIGAQLAIGDQQ